MKKSIKFALELGATMYMPATLSVDKMFGILTADPFVALIPQTMVVCLEDAVSDKDLAYALDNLKILLMRIKAKNIKTPSVSLFIRPRNIDVAEKILNWQLNDTFVGFVLPKFNLDNMHNWAGILPDDLHFMPTLETFEYFDALYQRDMRFALQESMDRPICLRIGGNDLLSSLNLRRPKDKTIYQTPVGTLIPQLVGQFAPYGFDLSAPVCEHFSNYDLLHQEILQDIDHGLLTKTVIHPTQIPTVMSAYKVTFQDYVDAKNILDDSAKSVFNSNGSMLEVTTHKRWAEKIMLRQKTYGVNTDLSLALESA